MESPAKTTHKNSVAKISKISITGSLESFQIIKLLPKLDGPLVEQAQIQGIGLVHAAIRVEDLWLRESVLNTLLKLGSDINSRNKQQISALHEAVSQRNLKGAALLIARGADVNVTCSHGQTPLHVAFSIGSIRSAIMLINAGSSLDVQDDQARHPADLGNCDFVEHFELLVGVGQSIRLLDEKIITFKSSLDDIQRLSTKLNLGEFEENH